jgi:hypothetical protein
VDGSFAWLRTDDAAGVLAYERAREDQRAVVAFNVSDRAQELAVKGNGAYRQLYPREGESISADGELRVRLEPRSAKVWIAERGRTP